MSGKVHVKKEDKVLVLSGKDKGKQGKVVSTMPKDGKVIVEGVNIITKHVKPKNQYQQGGLIKQEAAIDASKVMLVCSKCSKPARIQKKILENGSKARVCKKCGEVIDLIKESDE
jgi:large subunit ribosomal protein L24